MTIGADDASPTFLRHLLFPEPMRHYVRVMPINISPALRPRIELAQRLHSRKGDLFAD